MMNVQLSNINQTRQELARQALEELLRDVLRRGFHGTAKVEVAVQDGTIQHVRRQLEKVER